MKVTTKGQVTIPQVIREELGIYAGSEVEFKVEDGTLRVIPIEKPHISKTSLSARMRGKGTVKMTTDEIMALTRGEV